MPELQYDIVFPFPAARIELTFCTNEAVSFREYAVIIEAREPGGAPIPDAMLNWGYSDSLNGCYQYVLEAAPNSEARLEHNIVADQPVGELLVRLVPWRPVVPDTSPADVFGRLFTTFETAEGGNTSGGVARFTTITKGNRHD